MIYVDTSLLVALHVTERDSEVALSWFKRRATEIFLYSDWTELEVSSALSRKLRSGTMTFAQRRGAEQALQRTKLDSFRQVAVATEHFRSAESMVRHYETGLRSGDALHLAIAKANGAAIATLDQTFASAATRLGVAVEPVS
ncbi:type II toxin-antitoxin system VapC family toxin [uncultured Devosia sp.]|uniref:type II toxin-antitoxin system VapC family toxin n=1 Tax=uncultured Devosia sp. TaxID=211434 RepID=UPI0035CAD9D8